jgi:hypothetical protein
MKALQVDRWAPAPRCAAQADAHDNVGARVYELLRQNLEVVKIVGEVGDQTSDAFVTLDAARIGELRTLLCHNVLAKERQNGVDASAPKRLVCLTDSLDIFL